MATKRVLNRVRLDKIAAVGSPCQVPALATLIKSRGGPAQIYKATFEEALRTQLISESVSEVFWCAFEKQWAVREAFRTALADELDAGGDGSEATDAFVEAMRTIASTAATLAREAGSSADNASLESAVEQAVEKWLNQQETSEMKITTKAALKAAVASFDPAVTTVADTAIIKQAAKDLSAEDELPAEGPLALDKQAPDLSTLQREIAVLKLAPIHKAHFDTLVAAGQTAFLAKSETDRQAEIDGAQSADPVLYKCLDGIEIRKSDGAATLALAKRTDEQAAELAKLRGSASDSATENRATAEYPNVAKAIAVDMLKSIDQIGAETPTGKAIKASLVEMNKGRSSLFKSLGSIEVPAVEATVEKARGDFNTAVTEIMKRDKLGMGDAMSKARDEQPALFAEAYPDNAEQDA